MKVDLRNLDADGLAAFVAEQGWPRYRTEQLAQWLYGRGALHAVASAEEMVNLPKAMRERLNELCLFNLPS